MTELGRGRRDVLQGEGACFRGHADEHTDPELKKEKGWWKKGRKRRVWTRNWGEWVVCLRNRAQWGGTI